MTFKKVKTPRRKKNKVTPTGKNLCIAFKEILETIGLISEESICFVKFKINDIMIYIAKRGGKIDIIGLDSDPDMTILIKDRKRKHVQIDFGRQVDDIIITFHKIAKIIERSKNNE